MDDTGDELLSELMRLRPEALTPNAWAVKAGVGRSVWADIRRHGNPSRRTMEKLLAAIDSDLAEFEALRIGPRHVAPADADLSQLGDVTRGWGQAQLPPLPIIRTEPAGEWGSPGSGVEVHRIAVGEIVDRVARPMSLAADADAFGLTIVGDSMWPRYRPGRRIAVSPAAPVSVGDDVLVVTQRDGDGQLVLIKELVRRSASALELRQFNPDVTFSIAPGVGASVYRVMGEII